MRCLAIIPARGGSKGIPRKNLQLIGSHPLVAFPVVAAINSGVFSNIVVSTDDEEIASIGTFYGGSIYGLRPAELSADRTPMIDVIKYTLKNLSELQLKYDATCILQPTTPFRDPKILTKAWVKLKTTDATAVVGLTPCIDAHPKRLRKIDSQGLITSYLPNNQADTEREQRQSHFGDLVYRRCGAFYFFKNSILENDTIYGKKPYPIIVDGAAATTIDEPLDLLLAKAIWNESDIWREAGIMKRLLGIYNV